MYRWHAFHRGAGIRPFHSARACCARTSPTHRSGSCARPSSVAKWAAKPFSRVHQDTSFEDRLPRPSASPMENGPNQLHTAKVSYTTVRITQIFLNKPMINLIINVILCYILFILLLLLWYIHLIPTSVTFNTFNR